MTNLPKCAVVDCECSVSKAGFKLCLEHWRLENKKTKEVVAINEYIKAELLNTTTNYLSVTNLGELFNISNRKLNLIFLELGWIEKKENGWITTALGAKLCGQVEIGRDKKTFIKWPVGIEKSRVLTRAVNEFLHPESKLKIELHKEITKDSANFRSKFPANMRATDGHLVRSRGEMLIDNWLYMSGVAHAYERQLPIEEDVFCDFYIPSGDKVYIEYWGIESDAKYLERKIVKQEIYKKYNFNLIELQDKHIENLDDYLPKMLLKFNVLVD